MCVSQILTHFTHFSFLHSKGSAIVLDDAQYFDTASWTLTLAVSQQLRGVLVVVCLRPLKPPFPFEYQQITHCENAHTMTLAPLSGDDALTLAKQILGVEKIPRTLSSLHYLYYKDPNKSTNERLLQMSLFFKHTIFC
jgi:hypothetical protein